ncbi:DUF1643 domain-containing protein [Pseudarthrobacter sp. CC12]
MLAILANPSLTKGARTLRRVEMAAELLGFTKVRVANLFALPSHATGEIAVLGAEEDGWLTARELLEPSLQTAHGILLAYGATAPTGAARLHFGHQVEWLHGLIAARQLPSWHVGDGPRHPSRWQRWTYRAHPGVPFTDALRSSFVPVHADLVGTPR